MPAHAAGDQELPGERPFPSSLVRAVHCWDRGRCSARECGVQLARQAPHQVVAGASPCPRRIRHALHDDHGARRQGALSCEVRCLSESPHIFFAVQTKLRCSPRHSPSPLLLYLGHTWRGEGVHLAPLLAGVYSPCSGKMQKKKRRSTTSACAVRTVSTCSLMARACSLVRAGGPRAHCARFWHADNCLSSPVHAHAVQFRLFLGSRPGSAR